MIYAINYANKKYHNAQKLNTKTAYIYGARKVIEYGESDISEEFWRKNQEILQNPRGNGYWLWKPYFIHRTLERIKEGDYLIYADSGAAYVNKIQYLINAMENARVDIMLFEIKSLERRYTKRDAFLIMECDVEEFVSSRQRCATFMIFKKTERAVRFVKEWLEYAQDKRLITDDSNVMGKPNYEDFIDHRHDQSILSLLSKKYHIQPFRDASQYGNDMHYEEAILQRSGYPQIFDSHRNSDITSSWIVYRYKLDEKWEKTKKNIRIKLSGMKRLFFKRRQ